MVELAKPYLDVGMYTDRYDQARAFYVDGLGLAYEELLKVGGGVHQHRLSLHGAVLKLNSSRDPLPAAATNYVGLDIGVDPDADDDLQRLTDPDGTAVRVGRGPLTCVHWASSRPQRLTELLVEGLGATDAGDGRLRVGRTLVAVRDGGGPVGELRARGLRYLTVQVRDVRAEHARLIALGWRERRAPVRLGDTACISFVADPDGAPLEVSQRASLTGPLPPA
ncbi:MAG TPA: VOC family protein [Acidimicrobiales bacterium]|nr:VOC family protein [Acidimicrobiales bacterium]